MEKYITIALIVILLGGIIFTQYRKFQVENIKIASEKILPKISIVFVVKNNQKLLEYCVKNLGQLKGNFYEVVVLDFGSIDNTVEVAQDLLVTYPRSTIHKVSQRLVAENSFDIIKNYVSGDMVFIVDLYEISISNPNVYIPDIFKPIDQITKNEMAHLDSRIDGTKLLYLDKMEREKNSHILKENVIETLSNLCMKLDTSKEKIKADPETIEEEIDEIEKYLKNSSKDITMMLRVVGASKFTEKTLNDNMVFIFNDYSKSHGVSIDYQVSGKPVEFKEIVNEVILSVTQEILYTIVQGNLCSNIKVTQRQDRRKFKLMFKYSYSQNGDNILKKDSGVSYYIIQSIQNRLSLLEGVLRVQEKNNTEMNIELQLPISTNIRSPQGEEKK